MDQWLVRTAKNWIAGPYLRSQVIEMIKAGQLTREDEICPGNGYWIFLHERVEMLKHLGMECPRVRTGVSGEEEITEIENQSSDEEVTDSGIEIVSESTAAARTKIAAFENSEEVHDTTGLIPMPSSLPADSPPEITPNPEDLLAVLPNVPPPTGPSVKAPTPMSPQKFGKPSGQSVFPSSSQLAAPSDRPTTSPNPWQRPNSLEPIYPPPPLQRTGKIERPSVWRGLMLALLAIFLLCAVAMFRLLKY